MSMQMRFRIKTESVGRQAFISLSQTNTLEHSTKSTSTIIKCYCFSIKCFKPLFPKSRLGESLPTKQQVVITHSSQRPRLFQNKNKNIHMALRMQQIRNSKKSTRLKTFFLLPATVLQAKINKAKAALLK